MKTTESIILCFIMVIAAGALAIIARELGVNTDFFVNISAVLITLYACVRIARVNNIQI